ncbi:MAG: hypothetical protein AAGF10_07820, partial [Verrucomicrobiota bacterium]
PKLGASLVVPCVAMAAITVGIGLWSAPLFSLAEAASEQLLNPQGYIDAVLEPSTAEDRYVLDH